jgi:predicted aspartyl protease
MAVVWLLTRTATSLSRWSKGHSVTSQPQQRMGSPPSPAHSAQKLGGDTLLSTPGCTVEAVGKEEATSSLNPNATCFVPHVKNSFNHCDPSMVERSVIRAAAVDKTQSPDPYPPSLYVNGLLEGEKVRSLVDTGAEVSVISYTTLAKLPREVQAAFQDQAHTMTVTTVSGEQVSTKGPVLCKISILGREVTDVVIAMHMESEAILSLPTLAAMGGEVKLGGVNLLPVSSIRLVRNQRVFKVTVDKCEVIPARSQKVVSCRIQSRGQPVEQALIVEGTDECRQLKAFQVAHSAQWRRVV